MKKLRSAIILCGGKGTRLGAISKKIPKTLIKIHQKEVLWYIIKFLLKNKFNHFILPLGYKSNKIKKFVRKNRSFNTNIEQVQTGKNSNIGYRLFKILNKIKSENVLLINGDAIVRFNLNKMFKEHENKNIDATFLSAESKYQFGTVCLKKGKIINFERNIVFDSVNVRNKKNFIAYNYAGIIIVKKNKLLKHSKIFKKSENFEKEFYPLIIKRNKTNLKKIKGFFHSIDNMKDINATSKKVSKYNYKNIVSLKKYLNGKS